MKPSWSTACPDWEDRILNQQSLIAFEPLFPDAARKAMDVMRALRIVDILGAPEIGDCTRDWVLNFAAAIFGAYDEETGLRLIREFFLLVAKKNTKSTIAAAIMLTALILNWRDNAEFLIIAPTIEIAGNSFTPAAAMIAADEELKEILHVREHHRTITHLDTGAVLKVVAADKDTVSGSKATGVLVDELWLFGKKESADSMLMEATGGLVSRPEGFVIYLSTQSDDAPAGVFKDKLDYFRDVRDGKVEDNKSLPVLYEFPKSMVDSGDCYKPENWYVTNPNMGLSVSCEYLEDKYREAQRANDKKFRIHCAKHLNLEIGLLLRNDRWAGGEFWECSADKTLTLESLLERCEVAVVGIDGGGLDDLLGLHVIGREIGTRRWLCWARAWAHPIVLDRRKEIAPTLQNFANDGDLVICETPTQDLEEVAAICDRVRQSGLFPKEHCIGVDKLGQPALIDALVDVGFNCEGAENQIIGISQGGYLNPAIVGTEKKLSNGTLQHAGQRLMAWCVGNAKVEMKGSARAVTKQASGTAKIDPLIALFNAAMLMAKNPEARKASIYASRGVQTA